jgi:hypothetical protein
MNRVVLTLSLVATAFWCAAAFGQEPVQLGPGPLPAYYTYIPLSGVSSEEVRSNVSAATTIPMWGYTTTASRDSNQYSGVMVGRSPFFHGARTTNVPTFIVPVKVVMPASGGSGVFDPSAADATCLSSKVPLTVFQNSPIFQTAAFTMNGANVGTTQYVDAFQRASFLMENVSPTGDRYHTMLSPVTTLAQQTFNVPTNEGGTFTTGLGCVHTGNIGIMDIGTFDTFVQNTIVPFVAANGGGPTSFPIILLYNVVMADPYVPNTAANCCILGYHGSFGNPVQTYSPADLDSTGAFSGTSDVSALSHEVGEWMDDPLGSNPTPAWGGIGQVSGCQDNLEVGDPLSGTLFPSVALSGFTYHPQELAFFSWFYGSPSIGAGSKFSNNGKFAGDAKTCPPGGTN